MKHALIVASLRAAVPEIGFPDFYKLNKQQAATAAKKQAEADFAAGNYCILVYGLRGSDSSFDLRLANEGVHVRAIAGCIVSEGILEGARVYNEIMRTKLKAKLGRDIFTDKDESQKQPAK